MNRATCRWKYLALVSVLQACNVGQSAELGGDGAKPGEAPTDATPAPTGTDSAGLLQNANVQAGMPDPTADANGVSDAPAVPAAPEPGTPAVGNAQPPADANFMQDGRYKFAYVGRFDLRNTAQVGFNFAGSKIGVAFTGSSLAIRLSDTGADTFDVTIDGVPYASPGNAFAIDAAAPRGACKPVAQVPGYDGNSFPGCILAVPSSAPISYPIATGLQNGNHVAWISKRSEFFQATCGSSKFYGFTLAPGASFLPAPSYRARRLEFIGDSSFTGYGAAQRSPCDFTSRNCSSPLSIPAAVATKLQAEYVNLSSSGQGIYRSFYDHTVSHNLPVIYRQTQGLDASYPYDFSRDRVDAVVLSAGGDDLWGPSGSGQFDNDDANAAGSARSNFIAATTAWLADIRTLRPQATIFVTLTSGAINADVATLGSALQEAVAARTSAGDSNVVYFSYFPVASPTRPASVYRTLGDVLQGEGLWMGCRGHPSPGVANFLATPLAAFIAKRMNW